MKKASKLKLRTEAVRVLQAGELGQAAGGVPWRFSFDWPCVCLTCDHWTVCL